MSEVTPFGEILRRVRKDENLKQREMAEKLKITAPHLSMFERGAIPISDEHLTKLWRTFEFSDEEQVVMITEAWKSRSVIDIPRDMSDDMKCLLWGLVANRKELPEAFIKRTATMVSEYANRG